MPVQYVKILFYNKIGNCFNESFNFPATRTSASKSNMNMYFQKKRLHMQPFYSQYKALHMCAETEMV